MEHLYPLVPISPLLYSGQKRGPLASPLLVELVVIRVDQDYLPLQYVLASLSYGGTLFHPPNTHVTAVDETSTPSNSEAACSY